MKTVRLDNNTLLIRLKSEPDFKQQLAIIKGFPGRRWNIEADQWEVLCTKKTVNVLYSNGFEFHPNAQHLIKHLVKSEEVKENHSVKIIQNKALKGLRPYQIEGVSFVEDRNGFGYIADEMGLGKTIQAIGYMKLHPHNRPYVIVCTASMKLKWKREIEKWIDDEVVHVIFGETPYQLPAASIYIINYHILGTEDPESVAHIKQMKKIAKEKNMKYRGGLPNVTGWCDHLSKLRIAGFIVDEAHRLANEEAIWTRSFIHMFRNSKYKTAFIPLSGTPIRKRPKSLFTILNLGWPRQFPDRWKFMWRYCDPKNNGFGWDFKGASNQDELHQKLQNIMIRRLKKDVLPELPDKQHIIVPLEIEDAMKAEYDNAHQDFINFLGKTVVGDSLEAIKGIANLKQMAYAGKRNAVLKWIKDFLENTEDENKKVVIFAWHKIVIQDVLQSFEKIAVKIDGSTPPHMRQWAEDQFQTNPAIRVFLGNFEAAGEGLTLTASDTVIFLEFADLPGQMQQAADRVHRMGQESDKVVIYYLCADGTIDMDLMTALEASNKVVAQIVDGKKDQQFFEGDSLDLNNAILEKYRGKDGK